MPSIGNINQHDFTWIDVGYLSGRNKVCADCTNNSGEELLVTGFSARVGTVDGHCSQVSNGSSASGTGLPITCSMTLEVGGRSYTSSPQTISHVIGTKKWSGGVMSTVRTDGIIMTWTFSPGVNVQAGEYIAIKITNLSAGGAAVLGVVFDGMSGDQIINTQPVTPPVRNVTYVGNGGVIQNPISGQFVSIYNVTRDGATPYTVPALTIVYEGKDFLGWALSPAGSVDVLPGYVIRDNVDVTLYAIYKDVEVKTVLVIFDGNGGTITDPATSAQVSRYEVARKINEPYTVPTLQVSSVDQSGKPRNFLGWSKTSGGLPDIQPGFIITDQDTVTIYAIWESVITLTFDGNGSSLIDTLTGDYVTTYTVEVKGPYTIPNFKLDYTAEDDTGKNEFLGWSTSREGDAQYFPGDTIVLETSMILYAIWQAPSFTVEFYDGFSNTLLARHVGVPYGSNIEPPPPPDRPKCKFLGWSDDTSFVVTNMTVFAMWSAPTIWIYTHSGWEQYTPESIKDLVEGINYATYL